MTIIFTTSLCTTMVMRKVTVTSMLRHEQTISLQPQQEEPKWECEQLGQWPICPQQDTQVLTMPLPEQKASLQQHPGEPKWGCVRCEGACAVSPAAPSVAASFFFAPVREMDRAGKGKHQNHS